MLSDNERLCGTVKWFSPKKGYGFIKLDTGESSQVFLHKEDLPESSDGVVSPGDRLTFSVRQEELGPAAMDVIQVKDGKTKASQIRSENVKIPATENLIRVKDVTIPENKLPLEKVKSTGFECLGLLPNLLHAVSDAGYEAPTPIQTKGIPIVLAGKDLVGCAQTGTGKTAVFALPILQRFTQSQDKSSKKSLARALVLAPTRELAIQIGESFSEYGKYTTINNVVIYGGVGQTPQVKAVQRGVDVLVATPGRLLDLIGQRFINLEHIEILVLDEADRMLDMGFIHDVQKIIKMVPKTRQMLLFSATMPQEVKDLSKTFMHAPIQIDVSPNQKTVEIIEQAVYFVAKMNKQALLEHILQSPEITKALVFARTKHGANKVARLLNRSKIDADAIHGNKSQTARQKALEDFRVGDTRVLVATDVAARGIDVEDISHVIQYDLPNVADMYVHRIGRTGRAGAAGTAIAFCDETERSFLDDIEKFLKTRIRVVEDHPFKQMPKKAILKSSRARSVPKSRSVKPVARRRSPPPARYRNHVRKNGR